MSLKHRLGAAAVAAASAVLIAGILPASVAASGDLTPPTGTMTYWTIDDATQLAELRFNYADPESGLAQIEVSCDDSASIAVPYATKVFWPMHDVSGGCTSAYGWHTLVTTVINGDGLRSAARGAQVNVSPTLAIELVGPAVTGQPVTIKPILPADFVLSAEGGCEWEFRWGDDRSLLRNEFDETFGALGFDSPQVGGSCSPWTFTLPWVPYRQYEVNVTVYTLHPDLKSIAYGPSITQRFTAAVGTTERRILASNLPVAQVLPSTYTPIVGSPVTYTRYLIGGATACCSSEWNAWEGTGDHPIAWHQSGGSTFTLTTYVAGNVTVGWQRFSSDGRLFYAAFDPPVRYRDYWAPVATAPRQRIRVMATGSSIPILIDWGGSDRGWGIKSFQLQRSMNGGTWKGVALPSATSKSIGVVGAPGSSLRFRVRAVDKAGHIGAWAYGPTFRVYRISDASTAIRYSSGWAAKADPGAFSDVVHATAGAGRAAAWRFSGRDVAWIASRGPADGKAKVYIDGAYVATVDLYAATGQTRRIVFARHWTAAGTHTIRIVNAATSGRPWINDDGFELLR